MTEAVAEAPKLPAGRTVITQENMNAFYDEKLGLKPAKDDKPAAVEQPAGEKPAADPAAEAAPNAEDEHDDVKQARRNPKIKERFSKLSAERKQAQEDAKVARESAQREREQREALQRERDELKAKYEPPKTDPLGPKPTLEQFANAEEFSQALEYWVMEKNERERAEKETNERAQKEAESRAKAFKERQDAYRKEATDYDEKINGSSVQVSDAVRDAMLESDVGPQLLYHFATHPDVADKIASLPQAAALREVGKLEAKLGEKPEPKAEAKTPIAEVSKAPAPITPLNAGNSVPQIPVDGKGVWHGDFKSFRAARESGKLK